MSILPDKSIPIRHLFAEFSAIAGPQHLLSDSVAAPKTDSSDEDDFSLLSADLTQAIPNKADDKENSYILPDFAEIQRICSQSISVGGATQSVQYKAKLPPATPDVRLIKKRALIQNSTVANEQAQVKLNQDSTKVKEEGSPKKRINHKTASPFAVRSIYAVNQSDTSASTVAVSASANSASKVKASALATFAPCIVSSTLTSAAASAGSSSSSAAVTASEQVESDIGAFAPGEEFLVWGGQTKTDKYVTIGGIHHKLKHLGAGKEHIVYSFVNDAEIHLKLASEDSASEEFVQKMAEFQKQNGRPLRTTDVVIKVIHQGNSAPGRRSLGIQKSENVGYEELTARNIPLPIIFYKSSEKGRAVIIERFEKPVKVTAWKHMSGEQLLKLQTEDQDSSKVLAFFKKWLSDIANTGKDINDFYSRNVMFKKDGTIGVCDWSAAKALDKHDKKHRIESTVQDHLYSYLIEVCNESKAVWDLLTNDFNESIKKEMNERLNKEMTACGNTFPVSIEPRAS